MTDNPLQALLELVHQSGLSDRRFAKEMMGVDERTFRRYKSGESQIPKSKLGMIEKLRINIRRTRQGVSPKTQRELLAKAEAKRKRKSERPQGYTP